jgi:hypothetical protein
VGGRVVAALPAQPRRPAICEQSGTVTKRQFRIALEDLLGVDRGTLRDDDSRLSIPTWTSLVDVQIMVVLASELGLDEAAETLEYETVGDLMSALDSHGVFTLT